MANLVTLAEYKAYAGINQPNDDDTIEALIPKVSSLVKTYCRNSFIDYVDDPKTETFNGGHDRLLLREGPVISISSMEMSEDYGNTYTELVEFTDFALDYENNCVVPISAEYFPRLVNGYKVSYKAGYTAMPDDLKLGVMDLLTYYIKNDMAVHSPKSPGTNSVQIEYITTSALPAHIKRVLDFYKADWS